MCEASENTFKFYCVLNSRPYLTKGVRIETFGRFQFALETTHRRKFSKKFRENCFRANDKHKILAIDEKFIVREIFHKTAFEEYFTHSKQRTLLVTGKVFFLQVLK